MTLKTLKVYLQPFLLATSAGTVSPWAHTPWLAVSSERLYVNSPMELMYNAFAISFFFSACWGASVVEKNKQKNMLASSFEIYGPVFAKPIFKINLIGFDVIP